jgi:hypothetical protein
MLVGLLALAFLKQSKLLMVTLGRYRGTCVGR